MKRSEHKETLCVRCVYWIVPYGNYNLYKAYKKINNYFLSSNLKN